MRGDIFLSNLITPVCTPLWWVSSRMWPYRNRNIITYHIWQQFNNAPVLQMECWKCFREFLKPWTFEVELFIIDTVADCEPDLAHHRGNFNAKIMLETKI